jgi:two-component system CheB/CheR fusion protein
MIVPRTGHPSHAAMDARDVRDEHLQRIFGLLRGATGVDFRHYKLPTIERRLQRRLVLHRLSRLEDYLRLLRERPDEVMALYRDILIHVTRFFREPESFDALVHHVLPRIIGEHQGDATLRAWVAGCSTGEEAYSLAILMLEALGDRADQIPIQIFATDVSEDAIQQARAGSYPATIATDVSPERLNRFFVKFDGGYRIVKSVRDKCVFSRQDVTRDPPFSRLDLILCRNVLIYLSAPLQRRLMTVFHYALKPGRFLVLGHAETIGQHGELFAVADRRHRIYVKKSSAAAATSFAEEPQIQPAAPARLEVVPRQDVRSVQLEASRLLLDRFAPAGVVVDDDMQIVHFRGQTGAYLAPSSGEPTLHLFKMARDGLLHHLRLACIEARKTGQSARQDGVRVRQNGGWQKVDVEVMPLHVVGKPHFLVLFHPAESPASGAAVQEGRDSAEGRDVGEGAGEAGERHESPIAPDQLQTLEDELAATRTYLQSIIQEVEAANEELQSANEEILSSNEELQSTNEELDTAKEELQSTNEELNTVNDELHGRNEELSRANSDLLNILSSVQIAILIVAGDLRIRRFTSMAERMLNLIPSDVGRPIDHIKPNIDCPDLEHLIREAMDTVSVIERQVQDRQGSWFSLRIRPYKNVDNRIDGAVLALFDIDALRRQETELRETRHYAEAIVQSIRQPLVVLDLDLRVRTVNPGFLSTFGLDQREVLGCALHALPGGGWDGPMHRSLERLSNGERRVDRFHLDHEFSRVGRRRLDVDARRVEGPEGRPPLIVLTFDGGSEQGDGGT